MRVKNVRKTRKSLHDAAKEFISFKTAQKVREYCKCFRLLLEALNPGELLGTLTVFYGTGTLGSAEHL